LSLSSGWLPAQPTHLLLLINTAVTSTNSFALNTEALRFSETPEQTKHIACSRNRTHEKKKDIAVVLVLQNMNKFVFLKAFAMQNKKFVAFSILNTKHFSIKLKASNA
jgi:hypothetical protein